MWVWYVERSEGGSISRIVARARKAGPEGASFNQPQMYWKAIGTSVRAVYEHTYLFNRLWGRPIVEHPLLKRGSRGDLVVWAQEHLVGSGQTQLPVTGFFGPQTYSAVRSFQAAHGLPADGAIGTTTWSSLLTVEPAPPRWVARPARGRTGTGTSASRVLPARRPVSASLPAHAYETRPGPAP